MMEVYREPSMNTEDRTWTHTMEPLSLSEGDGFDTLIWATVTGVVRGDAS